MKTYECGQFVIRGVPRSGRKLPSCFREAAASAGGWLQELGIQSQSLFLAERTDIADNL